MPIEIEPGSKRDICGRCGGWISLGHAAGSPCRLLREARQYVSDAGSDEDPETQKNSSALLAEIDAALGQG